MRASIREVARRAEVSVGTVSNVLNRPDLVSDTTRIRVLTAIEELGFVRNGAARVLRKGSVRTLGVIAEDIAHPGFSEVARGTEAAVSAVGYDVIWCTSEGSPEKERRCLNFLEEQGVCGVIISPVSLDAGRIARLRTRGLQVVLVDRRIPGAGAGSVSVDHALGGELATRHLLDLGRRDLVFVTAGPQTPPIRQRRAGALRAMARAGLSPERLLTVAEPEPTATAGRNAARRLQSLGTIPTGVFCATDLLAIGLVNELVRSGVRVPEDVAVIGYDGLDLAAAAVVPLTTVRQPRHELGRTAAELVLADTDSRHVLLTPELVVRESAR